MAHLGNTIINGALRVLGGEYVDTINGVAVGSSPKFTDTTYGANNGVGLSGTTFYNSGVRSIATGGSNGTINVNTNGSTANVAVKGLAALAYKASLGKSDVGLANVANIDQSKAIKSITRSGTTFTATALDGTTSSFTQQDNNTTYTGANGVSLSGTTFSNSGVRSAATGTTNGTININTNGSTADVAVKGLAALAYKASLGKSDVGLGNVANLDQSKAIKSITRSGTTFTATALDGTTSSFTQQDSNTTYTGANGVSLSGTTFSNSGVRSIVEGTAAGTINVNTNGSTANVAVKDAGKAVKSITRSGKTFTATAIDGSTFSFTQQDSNTWTAMVGATSAANGSVGYVNATPPKDGYNTKYLRADGTWSVPPDNNTTYTGANGVSLSGTTFSNSGVRSIATGGSNGTINVNTNGSTANVAVKGLGTAAYTASTAYATSGHTHTTSIATSTGTNQLTLAANTKYAVTAGGTSYVFTTPPDTNTWRGIQNNLTSDSTSDSLSAAQGKALKGLVDNRVVIGSEATLSSVHIGGGSNPAFIYTENNNINFRYSTDGTTASSGYTSVKGLVTGEARDSTKLPTGGGTMTGDLEINNSTMNVSGGRVPALSAGTIRLYKDGIAMSNPATANDAGWIRMLGTGETDTVLEIATGDDADGSERILVRQYNTSNMILKEANLLHLQRFSNSNEQNLGFSGNLNDINYPSELNCTSDNTSNCPTAGWFFVKTLIHSGGNHWRTQFAYGMTVEGVWYRVLAGNGTWTAWKSFKTQADVDAAYQSGYNAGYAAGGDQKHLVQFGINDPSSFKVWIDGQLVAWQNSLSDYAVCWQQNV